MSSDRELTHIVRSWLEEGVNVLPDRVLDDVLAELPVTPQRRPWWRAWSTHLMNSTMKFAAAGLAVVVVAGIALAIFFSRQTLPPAATHSPLDSPVVSGPSPTQPAVNQPTAGPVISTQPTSAASDKAPFVVFLSRPEGFGTGTPHDLWAMRSDGTDAQLIFPRLGLPSVAWSKDGTQLLVNVEDVHGVSHVQIADVGDAIGPFVDTGFGTGADTACHGKSGRDFPCQSAAFSMAPDGNRVVFTQSCTWSVPGCSFISVLDLQTGALTELTETLENARFPVALPSWSPDGTTIAFVRETDQRVIGESGGIPTSNLYLIGADGTNMRQIDLGGLSVTAPQWSPDGSKIAVASINWVTDSELEQDIYTVRPDGTDLRQETPEGFNPGSYAWPEWTSADMLRVRIDGGLTFANLDVQRHAIVPYDIDLTDAIEAMEPRVSPSGNISVPGDPGRSIFWQPSD